MGIPGGTNGKESACQCRRCKRHIRSPGGGHGNPFQYSRPGESHGQRSLAGYTVHGIAELDATEHTCMHHTVLITVSL